MGAFLRTQLPRKGSAYSSNSTRDQAEPDQQKGDLGGPNDEPGKERTRPLAQEHAQLQLQANARHRDGQGNLRGRPQHIGKLRRKPTERVSERKREEAEQVARQQTMQASRRSELSTLLLIRATQPLLPQSKEQHDRHEQCNPSHLDRGRADADFFGNGIARSDHMTNCVQTTTGQHDRFISGRIKRKDQARQEEDAQSAEQIDDPHRERDFFFLRVDEGGCGRNRRGTANGAADAQGPTQARPQTKHACCAPPHEDREQHHAHQEQSRLPTQISERSGIEPCTEQANRKRQHGFLGVLQARLGFRVRGDKLTQHKSQQDGQADATKRRPAFDVLLKPRR